jgi:hypothetical protein
MKTLKLFLAKKYSKRIPKVLLTIYCKTTAKQIQADELVEKVSSSCRTLIAKYKEVYKATQAETKSKTNKFKKK